jgi:hypothetical protein
MTTHTCPKNMYHIAEGCSTQAAKDDTIIWQQQPLEPLALESKPQIHTLIDPKTVSSWANGFVTQVTKLTPFNQ